MQRIGCALAVILLGGYALEAQTTPQPPPQTARQALIEMFMSKNPNDLAKHLPEIARQTLIHKGDSPSSSILLRISAASRSLATGEKVETFDSGPNILVSEQPDRHERVEVAVEHDSLYGEQDEIELSIHDFKDGQEDALPVVPRLIFTLKQENEIWRLTEVTLAAHVPLTDPDYLKGIRKDQDEANERLILMRVNMLVAAEMSYATAHPDRGYSCSLSNLGLQNNNSNGSEDTPSEGGGMSDPGQGAEEWNGYRFQLTGCSGAPATKYRLTAAPVDTDSETKTFCADESKQIKHLVGGKPSRCFTDGKIENSATEVPPHLEGTFD